MRVFPNPDYFNHPKLAPSAPAADKAARLEALKTFLPAFDKALAGWMDAGRPDFEARIGLGDEALRQVQARGFALLSVERNAKAGILAEVARDVQELEAGLQTIGKPKFRDMNRALERSDYPRLYELVQQAYEELGVFEIASAYMRRPMRIKKLFVQLNNARETAIRYGEIDEAGLPALKTNYWHIDSDIWPSIKAIMYLNEVGLDQGPLRYVAGSHRDADAFEMVVRKTNDTLHLPTSQFLALPDELRMHALFGPYLTGEEPEVPGLLEREVAVFGEGSDLILFDNNGVHRGGFVRSGSRQIIQTLFEAVP